MHLTKLDFVLLCTNLIVFGGLLVLMVLRGPSGPTILLTVGSAGMAVAKIGGAFRSKPTDQSRVKPADPTH